MLVRPVNHCTSEGFSKQLLPLCHTASNDRCTCATRHMEQPAKAGLLPASLGSTRTYDADDCTFTIRNKFPSHLSSRLPSVQRRSETSFGLMEGPWDCGLTACDQSVTLLKRLRLNPKGCGRTEHPILLLADTVGPLAGHILTSPVTDVSLTVNK